MSKKRRNHSLEFKSKVALAALKGDRTLSELSQQFNINSNLIVKWKKQLIEQSSEVFAYSKGLAPDREPEIQSLQAKIGQLVMENDFLSRVLGRCELLDFPRSTSYYQPKALSDDDLALMKLIDRIHTKQPFRGSRGIVDALEDLGRKVNRKRVSRLMKIMGIQAKYPKPKTTRQVHSTGCIPTC